MSIKFIEASTEELKKECYKLRYNAYAVEFGFEDVNDFPDGLESDKYDKYSVHFLAFANEKPVGTLRMVLDSDLGFPVDDVVSYYDSFVRPKNTDIVEISRLVVLPEYRKVSHVSLGLFKHVIDKCNVLGINFSIMISEPWLFRYLNKFGFLFHQIGDEVEYHGRRAPFINSLVDSKFNMQIYNPSLYEYFYNK